jgi:hypothetical protein
MTLAQKLNRLDGRHKLAIVMGAAAWAVSIYFSQAGFRLTEPNAAWIGWFLGFFITTLELVFNGKEEKSMTLYAAGLLCYLYGIWTNVIGFYAFQHPDTAFVPLSQTALMSWFVGLILEILPEPLFVWGMGELGEGIADRVLNSFGGSGGKSSPNSNPYRPQQNQQKQNNQKQNNQKQQQNYKSQHKPQYRPAEPIFGNAREEFLAKLHQAQNEEEEE